ncbi:hypothetical protein [Cognatilysobacter terrigena]|uniref:hypothetical protein n=1 Tax=Cognatilysobacter terrigena TaxID=2488749 RepID=UPI00105D52E6|nr:hypothetical protein [Lysobacter terrigena]
MSKLRERMRIAQDYELALAGHAGQAESSPPAPLVARYRLPGVEALALIVIGGLFLLPIPSDVAHHRFGMMAVNAAVAGLGLYGAWHLFARASRSARPAILMDSTGIETRRSRVAWSDIVGIAVQSSYSRSGERWYLNLLVRDATAKDGLRLRPITLSGVDQEPDELYLRARAFRRTVQAPWLPSWIGHAPLQAVHGQLTEAERRAARRSGPPQIPSDA